jgi:ABC-type Fe3+/spermidine/putrescine transport system ATPase subunit
VRLDLGKGHTAELQAAYSPPLQADRGSSVHVSVRPEDIQLHRQPPPGRPNVLEGQVASVGYLGNLVDYLVATEAQTWRVQAHPSEAFAPRDRVYLELPPARCLCLPAAAGDPLSPIDLDEREAGGILRG